MLTYTYESNNGNLTKLTYGNGDYVSYAYDNLDRVVSETYNDTSQTIQYGYSADGNLAKIIDGSAP